MVQKKTTICVVYYERRTNSGYLMCSGSNSCLLDTTSYNLEHIVFLVNSSFMVIFIAEASAVSLEIFYYFRSVSLYDVISPVNRKNVAYRAK